MLIYDAQYTPEEYRGEVGPSRKGWGHSTYEAGAAIARAAGVRTLALFHHDPRRTDDAVAHLYNPLHPAVLQLVFHTLAVAKKLGKPVSVCGEMAGDPRMTRLLLGLGLTSFSMHPAHILAVKQQVLHSHIGELGPVARRLLRAGRPERIQELLERING